TRSFALSIKSCQWDDRRSSLELTTVPTDNQTRKTQLPEKRNMASPLKLVKSLLHIVLSLQICLIAVISVLTYDRKAESFSTSDSASMYFLITKLATVPICLFGIMLTFVESAPLLLFLYLPL